MKSRRILIRFLFLPALMLFFSAAPAAAAEGSWRPVWDSVLLWLNFLILVGVFYRYGRKPLLEFLRGRKVELHRELRTLETQRDALREQIRELRAALEAGEDRFAQLKARILEQGERERQQIVEQAREHSTYVLEAAKERIRNRLLHAKDTFRQELIDEAMDLATRRMAQEITENDNRNLIQQFLDDARGYAAEAP